MSVICSDSTLRALHRVLVCARFESYAGRDPKTIGDVMDVAEYLVALIRNQEGRSEAECLAEFRLGLQDIETRFAGFEGLVAAFDAGPQARRAGQDLAKTG
jgi:hypothetical protein